MKVIAAAAAVTPIVCAAATATSGGASQGRREAVRMKKPVHRQRDIGRHLQENNASDTGTVTISGSAFFDINGNGKLNADYGDGVINPISNTEIVVTAELWSCDNGKNLGYQITDYRGQYLFTQPAVAEGPACYYIRFDISSMEGDWYCSTPVKCATDNLLLSAGDEVWDEDVGITGSEFNELAQLIEDDLAIQTSGTDDGQGQGMETIDEGLIFTTTTYGPTWVLPSRPTFSPSSPTHSPLEAQQTTQSEEGHGALSPSPSPQSNKDVNESGLIQLNSQVRVMLSNIDSLMDASSEQLFNDVCGMFLNDQLLFAVPPISNITCLVMDQSLKVERRRLRGLTWAERLLGSILAVEVDVTGVAPSTPTIQTEEQVKFEDKLIGAFTAQTDQFVKLIKEEEAKVVADTTVATFSTLERAWADRMTDETEAAATTSTENSGSSLPVAGIAAIAAGGAVLLLIAIFFALKCRSKRSWKQEDIHQKNTDVTTSSPVPPNSVSRLPNSTCYFSTPVMPTSGEFEGGRRELCPTDMSSRVLRDVFAPPGKLRIMVANTRGYGPAIHTIKPESPVEGLLFVGDIIVAVNDVNTRHSKADEITRIFKETSRWERKITVLSLRR